MGFRQIDYLQHFNHFVELLHNLLDDPIITDGDDRDHRGGRV